MLQSQTVKKRKSYTALEKAKIVKEFHDSQLTLETFASSRKISRSLLGKWKREDWSDCLNDAKKRRPCALPAIEAELRDFIIANKSSGVNSRHDTSRIGISIIKEKAKELFDAANVGVEDKKQCHFSNGWYSRFMKRMETSSVGNVIETNDGTEDVVRGDKAIDGERDREGDNEGNTIGENIPKDTVAVGELIEV